MIFVFFFFFFFNDTATTEIYTLSLHDALPNWPSSPGKYVVRWHGSGGTNNGRSSATRSRSTRIERVQPIRSAITVAGIDGNSRNNSTICGSTTSTIDPFTARSYCGGPSARSAARTVFRATPNRRTIALIAIPSARCSRRISAHSSTSITLPASWLVSSQGSRSITSSGGPATGGVRIRLPIRGQFSRAADSVLERPQPRSFPYLPPKRLHGTPPPGKAVARRLAAHYTARPWQRGSNV